MMEHVLSPGPFHIMRFCCLTAPHPTNVHVFRKARARWGLPLLSGQHMPQRPKHPTTALSCSGRPGLQPALRFFFQFFLCEVKILPLLISPWCQLHPKHPLPFSQGGPWNTCRQLFCSHHILCKVKRPRSLSNPSQEPGSSPDPPLAPDTFS